MLISLYMLCTSQFTRDALIVLAGSKEKGRDFVYWTEVKDIPATDLATIERLWNKFSGGKFGYSVQKVCFDVMTYIVPFLWYSRVALHVCTFPSTFSQSILHTIQYYT